MPVQAPPGGFASSVERALRHFELPRGTPEIATRLCAYCELAVAWGQRMDLTAARSPDELVDLLLAKAAVPELHGRRILADVSYTWPLTGAERRAVCVTARASRETR